MSTGGKGRPCPLGGGHNLAEVVLVHAYLCSEQASLIWVGEASLEYVQDDAQDLAEHLVMHGHGLTAADHKELSSLFSLGLESHRFTMDHQVALAMANLNIPPNWNVLGSHSGNEHGHRESPLHLAVRWGLYRLAELLLCQPGGLMAVNMPNDEGVSPLQLAQTGGNTKLLELLRHPPNPLATPPAGLSQVWANQSHLLRFCHDTENLTLTVRQNLRWASEERRRSDILLLRERLRDQGFLREIKALKRERVETITEKEEAVDDPLEEVLYSDVNGETSTEDENMRMQRKTGKKDASPRGVHRLKEKKLSVRESQASSPTLAATARLAAMIHGKDRTYSNNVKVDQEAGFDMKDHPPVHISPLRNQRRSRCACVSYSYSSPKAKPSRPQLNRDVTIGDLAEGE
ncbi:unnamed protein product [Tetraodon nigroviridis]|uniref:(spotted green pufferfish) hypothetical protein n=1 Tax=Tetraodon nigroviridis TaxID=99883 RepID=Q4RUV8_TETNG|nr:unnamed protein product [Tetraodon nigroviridis]